MLPFIRRRPPSRPQLVADEPEVSPEERRFAAGTRKLVDLIAPGQIVQGFDHAIFDNRFVRVLVVTDWPRYVNLSWLDPLLSIERTIDVSLYFEPAQDTRAVAAMLRRRQVALESQVLSDRKTGRITDAHDEVQLEDIIRLQKALASGEEKLYSTRMYILIHASSVQELNEVQSKVSDTLAACGLGGLVVRPLYLEQRQGIHSVLPEGRYYLMAKPYRNVPSSAAATFMPFSSGSLSGRRGVYYGDNPSSGSMVIADRFALDNANAVVLGASGKGKSYFVKMEACQLLASGCEYFVVDPENEYGSLAQALGGQYVKISATSTHHINPFDLQIWSRAEDDDEAQDPLTEKILYLMTLIELMTSRLSADAPPLPTLSPQDKILLERALYMVYERRGITRDPLTHRRPAPVLGDLHQLLWEMGGEQAQMLGSRLQRYCQGSMAQVFNSPTNVDLRRRIVVFDLNALQEELRPIAMSVLTDYIWQQVRARQRRRVLLIDEIWQLLRHQASAEFVRSMAKRARKYGLGVTSITQDVEDFVQSPYGRPIVTNAEFKFLLGQHGRAVDTLGDVFDLSDKERQLLNEAGKGEGLLIVGRKHVYVKVPKQPEQVHRLITSEKGRSAGADRPAGTGRLSGAFGTNGEGRLD